MFGTCALCDKSAELCESHLHPKSIIRWIKETGSGVIRQPEQPNRPRYDGVKKYLLCKKCEDEFSKREKTFKNRIFDKYVSDKSSIIEYGEYLYYFAISMSWRFLKFFSNEFTDPILVDNIVMKEYAWKKYLNGVDSADTNVYIYVPDEDDVIRTDALSHNGIKVYLHHSLDADIMYGGNISFVYIVFPNIIFFVDINTSEVSNFINMKVNRGNGIINPNIMKMNNENIAEFFSNRVSIIRNKLDKGLSDRQKSIINESVLKNADRIFESGLFDAIKNDRHHK